MFTQKILKYSEALDAMIVQVELNQIDNVQPDTLTVDTMSKVIAVMFRTKHEKVMEDYIARKTKIKDATKH